MLEVKMDAVVSSNSPRCMLRVATLQPRWCGRIDRRDARADRGRGLARFQESAKCDRAAGGGGTETAESLARLLRLGTRRAGPRADRGQRGVRYDPKCGARRLRMMMWPWSGRKDSG